MPRTSAIPRASPPPSMPPRAMAPEDGSLCQRVSRVVSRIFHCLANFFCCCFQEKGKAPPTPDALPDRVPLSSSSHRPLHSTPPKTSSGSFSLFPGLPPFSNQLDKRAPFSLAEGIWLPSGELTVAKNADHNPINNILMYSEEIKTLMKEGTALKVATPSHCYNVSIPEEGTLLIVRDQKGRKNSSWSATLTERIIGEEETPVCSIIINKKKPTGNTSQILLELQQIAEAIEALNSQHDQTVRIQRELHQLDSRLLRLLSNLVHKKCYKEHRKSEYYRYPSRPVQERYEVYRTHLAIPVTEQNGTTTSKNVIVKLSIEPARPQDRVPRRILVFRIEGSPHEYLSLLFDNEGNLHKVSVTPSTSEFFTTDEKGSISVPRLQMLLVGLLTKKGMRVTGGQVSLHPLVIKLNPFAVLSALSTLGRSFDISNVNFLNDEFRSAGTTDDGGPRRQLIGDLCYYFLGGNPTANLPLAMAYGVPKVRAGASAEEVNNACQYLARLITYCHNATEPNASPPIVMGRVLNDLFFAMIHYMTLVGFIEEDLTDQETLLIQIHDMFPAFLANLLPEEGVSVNLDGGDYTLDGEDESIFKVDRDAIIETVAHYSSPASAVADIEEDPFAEQCKIIVTAFTGSAALMSPLTEGFNPKETLNAALIDQFGPIIRAVQQVAKYLPQNVIEALQELYEHNDAEIAVILYSERVQGAPFDPAALAQRIELEACHNIEALREKLAWIREFVESPAYYNEWLASLPAEERKEEEKTSHEQWVQNLVKFATGSPNLPNGMNIKIAPGGRVGLCVGHTCSGTLDVPRDHPRVGVPEGTFVDNQRAFFLNLSYCMRNGQSFALA